ncbi:STAS domain-containing protein [Flavimaricola sp.]|nr:STAS domain-containing protein [Flavimaricola sp.]MDA9020166.1 STAS domain-containing protein [Flavimaricola sp.]
MPESLQLPEKLDFTFAPDLLEHFRALRGQSISLDGQHVRFLGGLCAQILLSAWHVWNADGETMKINPSTSMQEDMTRLGLPQTMLQETIKT